MNVTYLDHSKFLQKHIFLYVFYKMKHQQCMVLFHGKTLLFDSELYRRFLEDNQKGHSKCLVRNIDRADPVRSLHTIEI